ncbi:MAG TPA: lipopolysaccharide biosynthesis protein [Allosphingosinicella sp.]
MPELSPDSPKHRRGGSLRAVFSNLGWMLGGRGVAAVLGLLYLAVVTRTLGLERFGEFTLVIGTAQTITGLVGFQTWQLIVRYGMEHLHQERMSALARLVKACLALDVAAAVAGGVLAVVAVTLLGPEFGWDDNVRRYALLFCFVSLLAVRSTAVGVLRLYGRFNIAAAADTALPLARLIGALLAMALAPRVESFILAWAAADLIAAAFFWTAAIATMKGLKWRQGSFSLTRLREENPGIVGLAGITNAGQSFTLVGKQGAVLLVGYFATPAAAGAFRVAHQLGQAMAKVGQLLSLSLFPELMRARTASEGPEHFRALLLRTVGFASIAGVLVFLLLLLGGEFLLKLVSGAEFAGAYPLLLLLGSAAIIDFVAVGFGPALIAADRAWTTFRIQLFAAVILVGLLFALVSQFGPGGAAAAMLAGSLLSAVLMGLATMRALRTGDPPVEGAEAVVLAGATADVDRVDRIG